MFPKLRQERLKAITKSTKAGEQILLYYTVSKHCLLTNNPDPKGRSSCNGHVDEQTRSRYWFGGGASTEHKAAAHDPKALPGNAHLVLGEYLPQPEQPFGAVSETELAGKGQQFTSRCSVVVFGNFVAFHIFCCFALLKKGSIKWKKHTFSESREAVSTVCHARWPNYFFFSKKKIPLSKP